MKKAIDDSLLVQIEAHEKDLILGKIKDGLIA
jgi:hypothetical protein